MDVTIPIFNTLQQLSQTIELLTPIQYQEKCKQLSGASIGQHCRHILELFKELSSGYQNGMICYEKRLRDQSLETNKSKAINEIENVQQNLHFPNKQLILVVEIGTESHLEFKVETNYFRELLYNLEHSIHHMALIRIGINELSNIEIPESFGVASSTIKYRGNQCAQ